MAELVHEAGREAGAPAAGGELRFSFGKNWQRFAAQLDEGRIAAAEQAMREMLGEDGLRGKTFLDVGSGSGLLSLVAVRMGAARVHSFDYDADSATCTRAVRDHYFPDAAHWTVERGDVLDDAYLQGLGTWDVVYSWGVLHHTGAMWQALDNAAARVRPGGTLFIAIYNDQGPISSYWTGVKRVYNRAPRPLQAVMEGGFFLFFASEMLAADLLRGRNPVTRYTGRDRRGMSVFRDVVDWIGGYPFEVASPEAITRFYGERGFTPRRVKTCGRRHGCNEFVLERAPAPPSPA